MAVSIYVASPLGFSDAGRLFYAERIIPSLVDAGYAILDPWALTPEAEVAEAAGRATMDARAEAFRALNRRIGRRNAEAIQSCDGLFAVLDGTDVDSGTAAEIGFAAGLRKPVVGYRGDFRRAGDNLGALVNLQVEYFVRMAGGEVFERLEDALAHLVRVVPPGSGG